jgi:hypothetical protein
MLLRNLLFREPFVGESGKIIPSREVNSYIDVNGQQGAETR